MDTCMSIHYSWFISKFWSPLINRYYTKHTLMHHKKFFRRIWHLFFVFLDPTVASEVYLHVGVSSALCLRRCSSSLSRCSITLPVLRGAESGSLTCLIAFDSSLSSLVDQWSSVLFIRNINAPHIPTASATAQRVHPEREALFSESLLLLALCVPYFRIIAIVCFSWFQH